MAAARTPAPAHTVADPARRAAASLLRWLRADVRESIALELAPTRRRSPRAPGDLEQSLTRWTSIFRRRRALVLARRHLIAAAALVIAAESVAALLGDERLAPWLLAPLALGLLDGVIALRQPVGIATVAQMLDRRLGLHDRLTTAQELVRQPHEPAGLGALVVREAGGAAADSFASARVAAAGRPEREWAWLAAGLVAVALLVALPGAQRSGLAHRASVASARQASSTRSHARGTHSTAARQHPPALAPSGTLGRPPLAVTGGTSGHPQKPGYSPYGYGAKSLPTKQLEQEGLASPRVQGKALAALSVGESSGAAGGSAAASSRAQAGAARGGKEAAGATSSAASKGAPAGAAAASSSGLAPGTHRGAQAPQVAGRKPPGAGAGGVGSGSSPPGGSAAGTAPGSNALGSALIPALTPGSSGLPLQAGYAPGSSRRTSAGEGVSQTPNGGGSGGRSAHASGDGEGSVSPHLGVIPPASNSPPAVDQGVLSSYFGSADQLEPRGW